MKKDKGKILSSENIQHCFSAALTFFLKTKPFNKNLTQSKLGKKIGKTQSYVGKLARGESYGTEEVRRKISAVYGYDGKTQGKSYDDFISIGQNILIEKEKKSKNGLDRVNEFITPYGSDKNLEKIKNTYLMVLIKQHQGIVEKFKDKETAYEINRLLLEIESTSPEEFEKIFNYIKMIYEFISKKEEIKTITTDIKQIENNSK